MNDNIKYWMEFLEIAYLNAFWCYILNYLEKNEKNNNWCLNYLFSSKKSCRFKKKEKKVDNRKYIFMKIIITDLIFVLQKK